MPTPADYQRLREELADKEALLKEIEAGKITLGNPWEGRADNLQRRIAELKSMFEKKHSPRS